MAEWVNVLQTTEDSNLPIETINKCVGMAKEHKKKCDLVDRRLYISNVASISILRFC